MSNAIISSNKIEMFLFHQKLFQARNFWINPKLHHTHWAMETLSYIVYVMVLSKIGAWVIAANAQSQLQLKETQEELTETQQLLTETQDELEAKEGELDEAFGDAEELEAEINAVTETTSLRWRGASKI